MQITQHTDYALRLLMYLAVHGSRSTVREAAEALRVSRHHLVKIATRLGTLGYVERTRGRGGGIALAGDPRAISIGAVFRELESCALVECFDAERDTCVLSGGCVLDAALRRALEAFCRALDDTTLADLVRPRRALRGALGLSIQARS